MQKLLLAILVLAVAPAAGFAQIRQDNWDNLKQLQPGHKIKIVDMNLKAWNGGLVSVSDEAVTIRELRKQQEITVERAKVLRVTDLQRSRRGRNALIGLAVGAAVGTALVADEEDLVPWGKAVIIFGIFGGPGAAAGALVPSYRTIYRVKRGPPEPTAQPDASPHSEDRR